MAEQLLGFVDALSGPVDAASYLIYYDDSAESIVVREDGNLVSSGISFGRGFRNSEGFTTRRAEFVVSFDEISSFPYFLEVLTLFEEEDDDDPLPIRDITLRLVRTTKTSGRYSSDGVIEIAASGSNAPYFYYTVDPTSVLFPITSNPTGGVFSGLPAGTYTLWAQSNTLGDVTSIDILLEVGLRNDPADLSDYGVKWFVPEISLTGTTYKTEIFERAYTGLSEQIKGSEQSFKYSMRAEGSDIYEANVISSNVSVNLVSETFNRFIDIASSDETKYIIKRSKFNGVTYDLDWMGYATPSSYQDVLFDLPYMVSVSGNDRLADLNKFKFSYVGDITSKVSGNFSQLELIGFCLNKLKLSFSYRIACNIFAENHTVTDMSPLEQTFVDADIYYSDDLTQVSNCFDIVSGILKIYGAKLFSWGGFWYIVRAQEFENETISYQEYDSGLVRTGSGSWNPRIDFKRPEENVRYRWIKGAQSRIFSSLYSVINLVINKRGKTGGLLNGFNSSSFQNNNNAFFKGYNLIRGNEIVTSTSNKQVTLGAPIVVNFSDKPNWTIAIQGTELTGQDDIESNTFIESLGSITYSTSDSINILTSFSIIHVIKSITVNVNVTYPPYIQLKWSFRLGNLWLSDSGQWSTDIKRNVIFYDTIGQEFPFDKIFEMPSQLSGIQTDNYSLRFYAASIYESQQQFSAASDIGPNLSVIPTVNSPLGTRINYTVDIGDTIKKMYFYELRSGSTQSSADGFTTVSPSDAHGLTNLVFWILVTNWSAPPIPGGIIVNNTRTTYNSISAFFLPNSQEALTTEVIAKTASINNNVELNYDVNQFDLAGTVNSEEQLFINYLKYEDSTPTSNWTITGGSVTKSIQSHVLDWVSKLAKRTRAIISGNFRLDGVDFTPLNVLHDPEDDNRLYLPTGVSSNFKSQEYSGELIEIASSESLDESAFTNGFKQNSVT